MNQNVPPILLVILGGDVGAYSLARAFHEAYSLKALVISSRRGCLCANSSILTNVVVEDLENESTLLATLLDVAQLNSGRKLMIFGCGDWYVRLLAKHRPTLERFAILSGVSESLLDRVVLKDQFHGLCETWDVPCPSTLVVDLSHDHSFAQLQSFAQSAGFPLVLKAASSADWHYVSFPGKRKVFIVENETDLKTVVQAIQSCSYQGNFLAQPYIPGSDSSMGILTTYSDRTGTVRFAAFGQTLQEDHSPTAEGNPVAIIPRKNDAAVQQAARLLNAIGYQGFANFDLKWDPATQRYLFFELNARLGRSQWYVSGNGANVARWLVEDLVEHRSFAEDIEQPPANDILFSLIPPSTLLSSLPEGALTQEVRKLIKNKRMVNPTDNPQETQWIRRLYPYLQSLRLAHQLNATTPERSSTDSISPTDELALASLSTALAGGVL